MSKAIEITDARNLQDGDIATFNISGKDYTGAVYLNDSGCLMWGDDCVRDRNGFPTVFARTFTTGLRQKLLPTEPLSVIRDIKLRDKRCFPLAVRTDSCLYPWQLMDSTGRGVDFADDSMITSFEVVAP